MKSTSTRSDITKKQEVPPLLGHCNSLIDEFAQRRDRLPLGLALSHFLSASQTLNAIYITNWMYPSSHEIDPLRFADQVLTETPTFSNANFFGAFRTRRGRTFNPLLLLFGKNCIVRHLNNISTGERQMKE
jgi:hypothetical protein